MGNIRFNRGRAHANTMADYAQWIQPVSPRGELFGRMKQRVVGAIREELTPRQRECLVLYYGKRLNMNEIGERLGIHKSTVSRTIKRGEATLHRCLRYGGDRMLYFEEYE